MKLKPDLQVDVEIQFQMNRLLFCQMHHALDLLIDIDIIFPDPSKVANFMKTKHKALTVARQVCFSFFFNIKPACFCVLV